MNNAIIVVYLSIISCYFCNCQKAEIGQALDFVDDSFKQKGAVAIAEALACSAALANPATSALGAGCLASQFSDKILGALAKIPKVGFIFKLQKFQHRVQKQIDHAFKPATKWLKHKVHQARKWIKRHFHF